MCSDLRTEFCYIFAIKNNCSSRSLFRSIDNAQEGGLAGPVVADKPQALAGSDHQVDTGQGADGAE